MKQIDIFADKGKIIMKFSRFKQCDFTGNSGNREVFIDIKHLTNRLHVETTSRACYY